MRAAQQGIGRHAATRRAVRLVEPRKPRFRRGEVLARAGQHAAQRAGAQTLAQVRAGGAAQQMVGVAGFILMRERVEQLPRGEGAGNRRAIGEGMEERGIIRALADEHHQHGENRLLPGDVVEQNARFQRVGGVHRVLRREGAHAQGIVQIFHVAQHEGQKLLVAAHRVGGAERAKHAPARGEGFARRAERTILALALDHAAAQAERLAAQFLVAELRAGQQHGFQQLGRVHAAAQRAAEPRALLPGLREDGRAAGEQAAAQCQEAVARRALRGNRADGQRGETTRRERRTGKKGACQHRNILRYQNSQRNRGETRGGKKPTYSLTPRAPCVNSGKRAND